MTPRTTPSDLRSVPAARRRRRRRGQVWTATALWALAVLAQGGVPVLHALAFDGAGCTGKAVSPASVRGTDVAALAGAGHAGREGRPHDAATCPVCRVLQHHGAALQSAGAAPGPFLPSAVARPGDAVGVPCASDTGPASPRAPPARA